ncbi:hypothetical protein EDD37DRAFT_648962 [Exophiala viscosa]|uniref:uncharacterized protein n=1 Tax=Exophiala viscosa TaxID=2486360 RepID=UPI002194F61D|nr:hypothetical protein EDD37DRAFT_648962 [Exophiala viscosa]
MTRPVLEFVNVTPANAAQAAQIRKQVRSHAAKIWGGPDPAAAGDHDPDSTMKPTSAQRKGRRRRRQCPPTTWSIEVRVRQVERERERERQDMVQHLPNAKAPPYKDTARNPSHLPPSPLSWLSGMATATIPASQSPVYHLPFVPVVLQNYLQHLAVAIPEIDGAGNSALLKTRWFPLVIHTPVVFQVIVLFSASHYAAKQADPAIATTILYLKQRALKGISLALAKGVGVRDELIAATAKMASYEAIWGDEIAYHCHMKAVSEMLRMRGGLASLGLDGFLARLLIFIDTNSAFLLNTFLHLPDSSFPRVEPFILPNLSRFVGEV